MSGCTPESADEEKSPTSLMQEKNHDREHYHDCYHCHGDSSCHGKLVVPATIYPKNCTLCADRDSHQILHQGLLTVSDHQGIAVARITPNESPLEGFPWTVYYEVASVPISTSPVQLTFADPTGNYAPFSQSMQPGPNNYTVYCHGLRGYPKEADLVVTLQIWTGQDWITVPRIQPVTFFYRNTQMSQLTQQQCPARSQHAANLWLGDHCFQPLNMPKTCLLTSYHQTSTNTTTTSSSETSGDEQQRRIKKSVRSWLKVCRETELKLSLSDTVSSNSTQSLTQTWVGSAPDTSDLMTGSSGDCDSEETDEEEISGETHNPHSGDADDKYEYDVTPSSPNSTREWAAAGQVDCNNSSAGSAVGSHRKDGQELTATKIHAGENKSADICISNMANLTASCEVDQRECITQDTATNWGSDSHVFSGIEEIQPLSLGEEQLGTSLTKHLESQCHNEEPDEGSCSPQQQRVENDTIWTEESRQCYGSVATHQVEPIESQLLCDSIDAERRPGDCFCDPQYPSAGEDGSSDCEQCSSRSQTKENYNSGAEIQQGHCKDQEIQEVESSFCLPHSATTNQANVNDCFVDVPSPPVTGWVKQGSTIPCSLKCPGALPFATHVKQGLTASSSLQCTARPVAQVALMQHPEADNSLITNAMALLHLAEVANKISTSSDLYPSSETLSLKAGGLGHPLSPVDDSCWKPCQASSSFFDPHTIRRAQKWMVGHHCNHLFQHGHQSQISSILHNKHQAADTLTISSFDVPSLFDEAEWDNHHVDDASRVNRNFLDSTKLRETKKRKTSLNQLCTINNNLKQAAVSECNENSEYILDEPNDKQAKLIITVDDIITSSTDLKSVIFNRHTNQR